MNSPSLLDLAMKNSARDRSTRAALVAAGLLSARTVNDVHRPARRSARATRNIFGAIRRNDIKAAVALLEMRPDLTALNADEQTAQEYARHLGRQEIAALVEQHLNTLASSERDSDND